jgi:hypothetical protein
MFNVPHVAFGQDLAYISQVGISFNRGYKSKQYARKWFEDNHLRFARSLTFLSTGPGITVFVPLEGEAREIKEADESKKEEILDLVGGWSFEESEM